MPGGTPNRRPARILDGAQEPKGGGAEEGEGPDAAPAKTARVKIDVDGFESRVRAIPGPSGSYRRLEANADGVFYLMGNGPQAALKMFDLKAEKEQAILEGVGGYELSAVFGTSSI